eukprot:Em0011g810a
MATNKFITEKEAEEVRKRKQEMWEKVRKPDQPLERPEESDNRTLYERLKEQKDKHQEEWEEQFKFKNMIYKGLDDEEAQFLHFVMQREAEQASQRWEEEVKEVTAYREAVAKLKEEQLATEVRTSATAPEVTQSTKPKAAGLTVSQKSQHSLVAGAIKRKGSRSSTSEDPKEEAATEKKQKLEARARESEEDNNRANKHQSVEVSRKSTSSLPGLAAYSSNDSSESEDESRDTSH